MTPRAALLRSLALVALWYATSTTMNVLNRMLFGSQYGVLDHTKFPLPLMLSSVQFLAQHALARAAHALGAPRTVTAGAMPDRRRVAPSIEPPKRTAALLCHVVAAGARSFARTLRAWERPRADEISLVSLLRNTQISDKIDGARAAAQAA